MNKKLIKILCIVIPCVIVAALIPIILSATGACSKDPDGPSKTGFDNEKDALVFSSGEFDEVFNPFFSTSAYDSSIAGQTQISMVGADPNGNNVTFGMDEPVVALDFSETMYDKNGEKTTLGDKEGTTVYQMVIKNGIKFSDGTPLTAHDVLFNMYMYLDPSYMGSSTMYSTDIVGLKQYQIQEEGNVEDGAVTGLENSINTLVSARMNAIMCYYSTDAATNAKWSSQVALLNGARETLYKGAEFEEYNEEDIKKDKEDVFKTWVEEITTDWNNASASLESMQEEYPFTEVWHAYFYNEGLISLTRDMSKPTAVVYLKDSDGKYVIDWQGIDKDANYTKEEAIDVVKTTYGSGDDFATQILGGGWLTASTMATKFNAREKQLYFDTKAGSDGLKVKNISGIQILSGSEFNGTKRYSDINYEDYDMLQITINGVDPKAKWNFSFAVAPMHYYSTPELTAAAMADTDYSESFGVSFSDVDFMDQVKRRNKVPMGAGIYKATNASDYVYDGTEESFNILKDSFLSENVCYFIANENFITTGGNEEAVYNAKIKHVRYKVVNSANTMTALQGGTIHYADPSANRNNIEVVDSNDNLERIMVRTAGYGYVGVNAKYVPNIYVRRAIMSAMNISLVQSYYPGDLSEPIYRPFSKVSWVYNSYQPGYPIDEWKPISLDNNENEQYYPFYTKQENGKQVTDRDRVMETIKGYLDDGGCYYDADSRKWYDSEEFGGEQLKYTFTIAGDTTDHPAHDVFILARDILNEIGFEVEVVPDSRALFKLASGSLAIWAAAWSSSLDPDMFQVYHIDSKATSVENWGYSYIKSLGESDYQYQLISQISDLIDQGRETIINAERTNIYRQASDLVMELAVELPLYQRSDMFVYNSSVLDVDTFFANPTPYASPLSEMWKVSFVNND